MAQILIPNTDINSSLNPTNNLIINSNASSITPILTDLGAALVFGLGFYFFKNHFKKSNADEINYKKEISTQTSQQ